MKFATCWWGGNYFPHFHLGANSRSFRFGVELEIYKKVFLTRSLYIIMRVGGGGGVGGWGGYNLNAFACRVFIWNPRELKRDWTNFKVIMQQLHWNGMSSHPNISSSFFYFAQSPNNQQKNFHGIFCIILWREMFIYSTSVSQLVSKASRQTSSQSIIEWNSQSANQAVSQIISQLVSQASNQINSQPVKQSVR